MPEWLKAKISKLTPAQQDAWEERAAIMEYDGKLERSQAEKAAYWDIARNALCEL
jgi:hypothetical protein